MASYTKHFDGAAAATVVTVPRAQRPGNLVVHYLDSGGADDNTQSSKRYYCQPGEQIVKVKAIHNVNDLPVISLWDLDGVAIVASASVEDADEIMGPFGKVLFHAAAGGEDSNGMVWIKRGAV